MLLAQLFELANEIKYPEPLDNLIFIESHFKELDPLLFGVSQTLLLSHYFLDLMLKLVNLHLSLRQLFGLLVKHLSFIAKVFESSLDLILMLSVRVDELVSLLSHEVLCDKFPEVVHLLNVLILVAHCLHFIEIRSYIIKKLLVPQILLLLILKLVT